MHTICLTGSLRQPFFIRNKKKLVLKIPFLVFRILWNKTLQQRCGLEETQREEAAAASLAVYLNKSRTFSLGGNWIGNRNLVRS